MSVSSRNLRSTTQLRRGSKPSSPRPIHERLSDSGNPRERGTGSRMICAVRDSPGSLLASTSEVTDNSEIRFRYRICVESCHGGLHQVTQEEGHGRTPQPRGRPSMVAQYAPQVTQWLRETPNVSAAEI